MEEHRTGRGGAVGRHNIISIRDAFGAHAIGIYVRLLLAWRIGLMEDETRRKVVASVRRIANDQIAIR